MKKYLWLFVVLTFVLSLSIVSFAEPVRPTLSLNVVINNSSTLNVTYIAKLSPVPTSDPLPKIDFYTGTTSGTFPNTYIGSAPIDNTGVAKISFHQDAGTYTGVAIWNSSAYGKIISNVVTYRVP